MNTNAPRTVTTPIMADDTRHCPMLIEEDRKRCGEIIRELYNNTECSASLAVDAGSQLQNLLSVVDAQDKKILELWKRVKVLTDGLQKIVTNGDYTAPEGMKRIAQETLNATPQQTAAQIERGHVEWMMKLPVVAIGCEEMARDGKCSPVAWLGKYPADGVSLVAIPPLPKESDSSETDLDEWLRRQ